MQTVGASLTMVVMVAAMAAIVVLWVVAFVQVARARMDQTAKAIWVLIIIIAPVIGAAAWFAIGSRSRTLQ